MIFLCDLLLQRHIIYLLEMCWAWSYSEGVEHLTLHGEPGNVPSCDVIEMGPLYINGSPRTEIPP